MKKTNVYVLIIAFFLPIYIGLADNFSNNHNHFKSDYQFQSRIAKRSGSRNSTESSDPTSFNNFLYSLVLPGFSEYRLGYKKTAMAFWISEALLVGSAVILNSYGESKTDDYQNFAVRHAGITKSGKSDGYWVDLGNYNSRIEYNEAQYAKRYYDDIIGPGNDWNWDSSSNRKQYDDLRINAEFAKTLSLYSLGALAINHLTSAITASYLSTNLKIETELKKEQDTFTDLDFKFYPKINVIYQF